MKPKITCSAVLLFCLLFAQVLHADEEADITKLVQDSQRAGFERHDISGYLSIWSKDARIVGGRSERPGRYETVLKRDQIEATRTLRFKAKAPENVKLDFINVTAKVDGDTAVLRYQAKYSRASEHSESVHEIYRLRKTNDGWKVYENRYWPVEIRLHDHVVKYNDKAWRRLDAEVTRQAAAGDFAAHINALFDAFRFSEAYSVCKKEAVNIPDDADVWIFRGHAAMLTGHAKDSLASFRKSRELDAKAPIPRWVRAADKASE